MKKYQSKMQELDVYDAFEGKYRLSKQENTIDIVQKIGHPLPEEYFKFLLSFGGLSVGAKCRIIKTFSGRCCSVGEEIDFNLFLGGQADDFPYRLTEYYQRYKYRLPPGFLPIAVNTGRDLICLCLEGENTGQVFFWDGEEEEDFDYEVGEVAGYSNVYLIANTFEEFVNGLEPS